MEEEIYEFVENHDINKKRWKIELEGLGEYVELYKGDDHYFRLNTSFTPLDNKDFLTKLENKFHLLAVENSRHGEGFFLFESEIDSAVIHDEVCELLSDCFNAYPQDLE